MFELFKIIENIMINNFSTIVVTCLLNLLIYILHTKTIRLNMRDNETNVLNRVKKIEEHVSFIYDHLEDIRIDIKKINTTIKNIEYDYDDLFDLTRDINFVLEKHDKIHSQIIENIQLMNIEKSSENEIKKYEYERNNITYNI